MVRSRSKFVLPPIQRQHWRRNFPSSVVKEMARGQTLMFHAGSGELVKSPEAEPDSIVTNPTEPK